MNKKEMIMAKLPPNMTELSTYINKDLKLRFKLACTAKEKTMSEVMVDLIEQWLEQQKSAQSLQTEDK